MERLKRKKECLMGAVEGQMGNLEQTNTEELGEVIDMIKDLSEAIYYCSIAKAMEEENEDKSVIMCYIEKEHPYIMEQAREHYNEQKYMMPEDRYVNYNRGKMYFNDSRLGRENGEKSPVSEREYPMELRDYREGRSPRSRRMYMEAKETHQDKTTQLKELEKYMQELGQDMTELIEGSSPEEKQYLEKKLNVLASKIGTLK